MSCADLLSYWVINALTILTGRYGDTRHMVVIAIKHVTVAQPWFEVIEA